MRRQLEGPLDSLEMAMYPAFITYYLKVYGSIPVKNFVPKLLAMYGKGISNV